MGQALYRKYRPKSLDDIVGQEHITTVLKNALKTGNISHAYLLTGPRGVGKTSVARILAHLVNDIAYEDESANLDIIEIDAASHRRIDEIRDLRERVHSAPSSSKYKVYIIDEVHMLTKEAFNALLKTLEEPPAHVIFILATTEAHKLPETIISRTQRLTFKPVDATKLKSHLAVIAKAEKIKISADALQLIAKLGEGSFRDSISLLDQVRNQKDEVTESDVLRAVGRPPDELITALLVAVRQQDLSSALSSLYSMRGQGYEAASIAKQINQNLRESLAGSQQPITSDTLEFMSELINAPASPNPAVALEIALLERFKDTKQSSEPLTGGEQLSAERVSQPPQVSTALKTKPEIADTSKKQQPKTGTLPNASSDNELWQAVLESIKKTHNTLYGILRMAKPVWNNDRLQLGFHFAFHQKRVNESANRKIISEIIRDISGREIFIEAIIDESIDNSPSVTDNPARTTSGDIDDTTIESISNIFGGVELLES